MFEKFKRWLGQLPEKSPATIFVDQLIADCQAKAAEGPSQEKIDEFSKIRSEAEMGDAEAQMNLGGCLHSGDYNRYLGISEDEANAEGFKWLHKSADKENVEAYKALGFCYQYGHNGVEENHLEAVKWFSYASALGDKYASYWIFQIYLELKDEANVLKWLKKAAAQGHDTAQDIIAGFNDDQLKAIQ